MLRNARLYENDLQTAFVEKWYDPEYFWYFGPEPYPLTFDRNDEYQFVSVDENETVLGYISFCINRVTQNAYNFCIMSFQKGNMTFLRDVFRAAEDVFEKFGCRRLTFWGVVGNPAVESYRRLVDRYGGGECSYEHDCVMLMDGRIYDSIGFEILNDKYYFSKGYQLRHRSDRKG